MAELFKNLYNEEYIGLLCENIIYEYPTFNDSLFKVAVFSSKWESYELKERMRHISTILEDFLPQEYSKAITLLCLIFKRMKAQCRVTLSYRTTCI